MTCVSETKTCAVDSFQQHILLLHFRNQNLSFFRRINPKFLTKSFRSFSFNSCGTSAVYDKCGFYHLTLRQC